MEKWNHAIKKSRRIRKKESSPGIGIEFKYIEAAEFLGTIPKHGVVDDTGGVRSDQKNKRSPTIETIRFSVTTFMNYECWNINIQHSYAIKRRDGGSGENVVDKIMERQLWVVEVTVLQSLIRT